MVEKNNNSYYMINGNRVGFRDVSKKLEEFAIDLRYNRFLILQGEVEQISLMKPKGENEGDTGMLEFLEDIIGTSRYKLPIKQLHDKYYVLNEERTMFVNRVNICKKELSKVSELKDEAVKALELQNKIYIEQSKIFQLRIHEESRLLENDEAEYAQEEEKLKSLNKRLAEEEAKCAALATQEKEKAGEYLTLKNQQDIQKKKFDEFEQKNYYLHETKKTLKGKLKTALKQIKTDEAKLAEMTSAAEQNNDDEEIEQLEAKRAELLTAQTTIDEQLKEGTQAAQEECADLIAERDALDVKLAQFKEETSGKKKARDEAENNLMVLTSQRDKAKVKVEQLETKLKHLNDETVEKRRKLAVFETELPKQEGMIEAKGEALEKLERDRHALLEEMSNKNEELQMLSSEKNSAKSKDDVHNALMEQIRLGRLQGIFGKLGSLGAIDKKYDIAASTAGGRLYNYVVDTSENAKEANRFLKEFNKNRENVRPITFIILDKLIPWTQDYHKKRDYPEGVPRLIDLVRVNDERFMPAFYFNFSDTLVANDLEQASRIGHGQERHRVISLKGDLIEPDGAITGGGRPYSGAMGTSVTETVFDQKRIDDLEAEMAELRERKQQIDLQVETTRRELEQLKRDQRSISENFDALKWEVEQNVVRVKQMEENLRNARVEMARFVDNPEIEQADADYQAKKEIYEREEAKMTVEKEKLDSLNEEINSKLITQLDPIKKRKKAIEKEMKELVSRLNSIASDRKNSELQLKKTEKSLEASRTMSKELEEELEKNKAEAEKVVKDANENAELYEQSMKDVEELGNVLKGIQKESKKLEEAMKKAKSEKVDVGHEIEKKLKVLEEKRKKKNEYSARLADIVLNQIDLDENEEEEDDDEGEEDEKDDDEEGQGTNDEEMPAANGVEESSGDAMMVDDQEVIAGEPQTVDPNGDADSNEMKASQATTDASGDTKDQNGDGKKKKKKAKAKKQPLTIPQLTGEELEELNIDSIKGKIKRLEGEFNKLNPNYAAIDDYKNKREDFKLKSSELDDATARRDLYMEHMKQTKEKRLKEFKTGYHSIAHKLKELYRTITLGGDADLEFVDSLDPFSEGINFAVRPNKKSWKNNINLSGGEKTLSSLALIFALHYYKPSPLYIMDEIDAALDFKNVSIIANYIKQRTRNTQFLIISLRSNMYELAEMLIGVYKTYSISKTVAFDPAAFEKRLNHTGPEPFVNSQPTYSSQPPITSSQPFVSSQPKKKQNTNATKPANTNKSQPLSTQPPIQPLAPTITIEKPAPPPLSPPRSSTSSSSSSSTPPGDASYNSEEDGDLMDLT